uniref:C2H2-type domain-containing protein n=1 Tax=Caenorhabditis japonica TaxID=281687 RepID=A0A8R1ERJ6_CAEJA
MATIFNHASGSTKLNRPQEELNQGVQIAVCNSLATTPSDTGSKRYELIIKYKKPYACGSCKQRFHARDRFAVHLQKYHQMSIKSLSSCEAELGFGIWSKSAVLTSSSDGPGRILHLPECSEILSAPSTSSEPPEELVTPSVIT